jgi:hypothetical protein
MPIEAKLTATPRTAMGRGIMAFRETYGDRAAPGWVVYSGDHRLPLGNGILALPFSML